MKMRVRVALATLIIAASGLNAFAQGPDNGDERHPQQVKHPQQQAGHARQPAQKSHGSQAAGQQPSDFRKGHVLAERYRSSRYQVSDWKTRGLKTPPSGHRWVNVDGHYLLIAAASGVIASAIAHR